MNVLEIIQEAAKRLCIMIPTAIPAITPTDTNSIDYDANLLMSCLNGAIKQLMVTNLFNQSILTATVIWSQTEFIEVGNMDPTGKYPDFSLNMTEAFPDFEELIGDGYTIYANNKKVIYRQLTNQDFIRLARISVPILQYPLSDLNKKYAEKEYMRDMPSEDRTTIPFSDNLESGFYMYEQSPNTRIVYFCNNLLTIHDFLAKDYCIMFNYRSNYGVISGDGAKRLQSAGRETPDLSAKEILVIPEELAILGIIIKYKAYYGIDYALEMGEQKAMLDALKENQENIQITHLDKKKYYHKVNI